MAEKLRRPLRIGLISLAMQSWAAGATFTAILANALRRASNASREELFWIAAKDAAPPEGFAHLPLRPSNVSLSGRATQRLFRYRDRYPPLPGEFRLRKLLTQLDTTDPRELAYAAGLDVVLPALSVRTVGGPRVKTLGWIPDFQHRFLPEFFSADEFTRRDVDFRRLAEVAAKIMFSSRNAADHFSRFYPDYAAKAHVVSFPSVFAYEPPLGDPCTVTAKYRLPQKFALVANQLWAHKNHSVVLQALQRLALKVPLVIVGRPSDYRDPRNRTVSRLLQEIAERGLAGQVTMLGEVPFADLVGLLRQAAVVIQPSRFEGWSTIVEDVKALGRPVFCSDLEVHREQAPQALGFFGCDDPAALAALLRDHWDRLPDGPNPVREACELAREKRFADEYGLKVIGICHEVAGR